MYRQQNNVLENMGKAIIEGGVVIVVKAVYAEVLSKVDVFSETKFFSIDRLIGQ